jgi:hypothetical protein
MTYPELSFPAPVGMIDIFDIRQRIIGRLFGPKWTAPVDFFEGPDQTFLMTWNGISGEDAVVALAKQRQIQDAVNALLVKTLRMGEIVLQFADGTIPPSIYWSGGLAVSAIELGQFVTNDHPAWAHLDQRPLFADRVAFDSWLARIRAPECGVEAPILAMRPTEPSGNDLRAEAEGDLPQPQLSPAKRGRGRGDYFPKLLAMLRASAANPDVWQRIEAMSGHELAGWVSKCWKRSEIKEALPKEKSSHLRKMVVEARAQVSEKLQRPIPQ